MLDLSGVKLSCMELTLPVVKVVVTPANNPLWTTPKRTSLPSMLPPGWLGAARHDAVEDPTLPAVGDHLAKADHDRARQHDHQQHLVGDCGRILERMGSVGVEEATPIGAHVFNGLELGHRPERDRLL